MHSLKKIWLFPVAWWLIWIVVHAWFLVHEGWALEIALTDSLVSNVLLAGLCTGVLFSVQYNRPEAKRLVYLFAGILLSSAFWAWLCNQLLAEIFSTEKRYLGLLAETYVIRMLTGFFMITLFAMMGWIIYFIKDQLDEKSRKNEVSRLARESELIHLRQQLQPHFLFNTLNSVNALVSADPTAAKKMILQLSDFLRGTLKKDDSGPIPLKEEMANLQLYLDIEKVRFGNRLETIINLPDSVEKYLVPVFLLQPLLENAIKFGLYDTLEKVTIEIDARYSNSLLTVSISNPFDAGTSGSVHGTGFGLNAVSRRLFLLFNRTDLLEITSTDTIFTATIKIPQEHV